VLVGSGVDADDVTPGRLLVIAGEGGACEVQLVKLGCSFCFILDTLGFVLVSLQDSNLLTSVLKLDYRSQFIPCSTY
jgi:hypothetical protein